MLNDKLLREKLIPELQEELKNKKYSLELKPSSSDEGTTVDLYLTGKDKIFFFRLNGFGYKKEL